MSTICDSRPTIGDKVAIRQMQGLLNKAGGYSMPTDGDFGNNTESKVRDWQTKNNIIVDGVVGGQTWPTICDSACKRRPTLKRGSPLRGAVKEMQALLNKAGGYNMPTDGDFGGNTENKVRDWQKKNGLSVDGVVGAQTWPTLCTSPCETCPVLRRGSTNKFAVRKMQDLMNKAGGYGMPVDGDFGGNTENKVRDWQTKNNIIVDGVVGGQTWPTICQSACQRRPTLKRGSPLKGAVKEMQALLNKAGRYNMPTDGDFGGNTENKLRDWQTKNKIIVDGVVAGQTWRTICDYIPVCKTHPTLRRGSVSRGAVKDMQGLLNEAGGYNMPTDGDFGGNTENKVRDWQTKNKIIVDGVVGAQTWPTICNSGCKNRPVLKTHSPLKGAVRDMQALLNKFGGYKIPEDGDFGGNTERHVRDWQTKSGIIVDGVVATQTWSSLCDVVPVCESRPRLGDKNQIREMQKLLNDVGGYNIPEDGKFGSNTERTVRDFQSKNGVRVDGVVGPATWAKLCGLPPPPPPVIFPPTDSGEGYWTWVPPSRKTLVLGDGTGEAAAKKDAVKELQALLNNFGAYGIAVDGDFGQATVKAVREYQAWHGLHVNGVVSLATWATIFGSRADAVPPVPPPAACSTRPTLKQGSTNKAAVLDFQVLFNKAGNKIEEDGAFGSYTERAVRDWQKAKGVTVNGIVDAETWHTLCVALLYIPPSSPPSPLPGSCETRPILQKGSTDKTAVRDFQVLLNAVGGYSIAEDGAFGDYTVAALRPWQKKNGNHVDRVVGPTTWGTLCGSVPCCSVAAACTKRPFLRNGAGSGHLVALKDAVAEFQVLLNMAGGYDIPQDGLFGNNTENTVRDYQAKTGLGADGVVGSATWHTFCIL